MRSEKPAPVAPVENRRHPVALLGTAIVVGLIAAKNPIVPLLLLTDGVAGAGVLLCASLGGIALLPLLGLGPLPRRWGVLLGAGLGIGLLATLVLLLGLAGLLHRPLWVAILAGSAVAGGVVCFRATKSRGSRSDSKEAAGFSLRGAPRVEARGSCPEGTPPAAPGPNGLRWLWLLVCPFAALAILVSTVPPGYLWAEEGNGYDVLEYHLQMPKEYHQAGRISYAPHNVYANFPANVEMLYLLCMVLDGDAIDAAGICQMLNAGLALLTVAAAWLIGRQRSPAAGIVVAVATAGIGWLTYLCGLAYVENGMLLFGMLSTAALIRAIEDPNRTLRWCAVSGLLAGFSLGCKYTAAVLIGLPLTIALLVALRGGLARRLAATCVFVVAQAAAFAPWAIKNAVLTGNPVFPLAGRIFTQDPPGWGRAQSEHFAATHSPAPGERGCGARMRRLWQHIPADRDQRFGPLILVLGAWASLACRGDRIVRTCWLILAVQLALWLFTTHLYARFAVPLIIPLVVLAGRLPLARRAPRRAAAALLIVGTAGTLGFAGRLYLEHLRPGGQWADLEGATGLFTGGLGLGHEHLAVINHELPDNARILMIGDAKAFYFRRPVDYCVVFNRNPFVELLRAGRPPGGIVAWLANRGYTHVLVNWSEIKRLGNSRYGFCQEVTPELFRRLTEAGLAGPQEFTSNAAGPGAEPYAALYQVPSIR